MSTNSDRLQLPSMTLLHLVVEFGIIIFAALLVTHVFMDMSPNTHLGGNESEYLMATAYTAYRTLHSEGYIPLWQPLLGQGDTVVSNPFSFLLNPLLSWPSLIIGPNNGVKLSMILMIIVTGIGGWVLARILGLHSLARVTLGLLCIGRGNLHAILAYGFFQVTANQVFFPWILAGVCALFWFQHRRWPVVLTAVSVVLMFWSGLIWYMWPWLIFLVVLTLVYIFRLARVPDRKALLHWQLTINWSIIRRMALAGVLTILLAAATLFPLVLQSNYFGSSLISNDPIYDLTTIINQYFSAQPSTADFVGTWQAFYNYTTPLWYLLVIGGIIGVMLILRKNLLRHYPRSLPRLLLGIAFMLIFVTLWGAGLNPVITFLYQVLPFATQFRHVERVLAVGSFLVCVLLVIGLDMAWMGLVTTWLWENRPGRIRVGRALNLGAAVILIGATFFAATDVLSQWTAPYNGITIESENTTMDQCLSWLHDQYGDAPVSVWVSEYPRINVFFNNNLRFWNLTDDFYKPQPLPSTLMMGGTLIKVLPLYSSTYFDWDYGWETTFAYTHPVPGSPTYEDGNLQRSCFLQRTLEPFSYAFTVPVDVISSKTTVNPDYISASTDTPIAENQLSPWETQPVTSFVRHNDYVALVVPANPAHDLVLTVNELAFPGWNVRVNDTAANLEIVGGQVGVILPAGTGNYYVLFQYRPTSLIIGLLVTLAGVMLCSAYLLRAERLIPLSIYARMNRARKTISARNFLGILRFMVNPNILGTETIVEEEPRSAYRFRLMGSEAVQKLPEPHPAEITNEAAANEHRP